MAGGRNLFSIRQVRHDEDQLTEMLAWLASTVPAVTGRLVELGSPTKGSALIRRTSRPHPRGRLDALSRKSCLDRTRGRARVRDRASHREPRLLTANKSRRLSQAVSM